jgi:uncharacterized protein (TIGR00369 family)
MTKSLIEQYVESNHFGRLIGMDFEIINPGEVTYKLTITKDHLATPYAAHGGCLSALMDATMGVAALSMVEKEFCVVSTIEMKLSFLEAVLNNDKLKATSKILRRGGRIIFAEAEIKNQNEKLVAKGSGTFSIVDGLKAGYKK